MFSVADTGAGMSAETQKRLFEPFFTTKPIGRGTGLGLATVYGIVKQNNGHITVRSELGSGTTFRIYLPVAAAPDETAPRREKGLVATLTGTETILVVEDNGPLRRLNERILQRHGYTVLTAENGEHAHQICREHRGAIDVVLTDVVMPGDSGLIVAESIRRRHPEAKVVYMSGYTGDAVGLLDILDRGGGFLQKPFDAAQLLRAVRDVLSSGASPPDESSPFATEDFRNHR